MLQNDEYKLLWDFTIQYDRMVEARRLDITLVETKRKAVGDEESRSDFSGDWSLGNVI